MKSFRARSAAFTLVELLVVISILGVLMALLVPAVNAVRDSMRRAQCKNNLKQIADAAQQHLAAQEHFPSSGWGYGWTGDPDRGFGARQPGGWIYNCLPFMGYALIHDTGKGASNSDKYNIYLPQQRTAMIPILICPTRRRAIAYPSTENQANSAATPLVQKTDYAANQGSYRYLGWGPSFSTSNYTSTCFTTYPNCAWANSDASLASFNGISTERSEVQAGQVSDGLSNVFFAGEKYLNALLYYTGSDGADNDSALEGNDWDVNRSVADDFISQTYPPLQDDPGLDTTWSGFGSAHTQGLHFVFCDGHVALISYQIDFTTYRILGTRNYFAANPGTKLNENY